MKTSFDEIKRMSFRALDAAGAPQGVDEDSAYATAWLEASGLPGLQMLGDALDGSDLSERKSAPEPELSGAKTSVDAHGASAVFLGPGLVDTMTWLAEEHGSAARMEIAQLKHAGFLVAFVGQASGRGTELSLRALHNTDGPVDVALTADAGRDPEWSALAQRRQESYQNGIEADDDAFKRVYAYSRKILVPETEESRLSGAGAGLTDND